MVWTDWFKAVLALVVWREAQGEGEDGMRAVAHVIRNRVEATHIEDSWDDVIEQKWQFSSLTAPGDAMLVRWPRHDSPTDQATFQTAMEIAERVYNGSDFDLTNGAHFYANLAVISTTSSFWAVANDTVNHPQTAKIGHHTFFK